MSISLIYDVIFIVILLITMLNFLHKGFLAGITELLGSLASVVCAFIFSPKLSVWIFDSFFKAGLIDRTTAVLDSAVGSVRVEEVVSALLNFLPESIVEGIVKNAGILATVVEPDTPGVAAQIIEQTMMPVIVPFITIVLFFLILIVAKVLLGVLVSAFTTVNAVPVVGSINKIAGLAMGVITGGINIYIVLLALSAIAVITGNTLSFLNTTVLQDSFFGSLIWNLNPFK